MGGRGQKDSHDKSIGKGGPVPCSWQSSLWVMLLKKMDNRSSPEGRPAALAPHSWDIPSPSLKPSVNTSLFQKCVGPSGFGLSPSLRSSFPSVAFSLWCMRWTCPTPQRPESSTSAGVWASVRTNKLITSPACPQMRLKSKMCKTDVPMWGLN